MSEPILFSFGKTGFVHRPIDRGNWIRGKVIVTHNAQQFKYYLEKNDMLILSAKKHTRNDYQIYLEESYTNPIAKVTNNFLGNQYTVQNILNTKQTYQDNLQVICKIKYVSDTYKCIYYCYYYMFRILIYLN